MITQREINNAWTIATKEFRDNVLSKRFLIIGIFYVGVAFLLMGITVLGFMYNRDAYILGGFKPSAVLSTMNMLNFILALLAVIVSSDAISIERKDRTIYQLLSKPVDRSTVVLGKFIGSLSIVSVLFVASAIFAYALTAVLTGIYPSPSDIPAVLAAILSMLILLAVYVAIGMFVSTITRNPLISILGSIMAWMGLLFCGIIGNMLGSISASAGQIFLLGDPFPQYPIYAKVLVWIDPLSHGILDQLLSGDMANAVASGLPLWANIVVLVAYTVLMLAASIEVFKRLDL